MSFPVRANHKTLIQWIALEERVTVHFLDEQGLSAEVTGCNAELVALSIETRLPLYETRYFSPAEPHGRFSRLDTLHTRSGTTSYTR